MCVALPPNQPMSISGQGVGKFEQSSLFMHLPGDHDDYSDDDDYNYITYVHSGNN